MPKPKSYWEEQYAREQEMGTFKSEIIQIGLCVLGIWKLIDIGVSIYSQITWGK